MRTVALPGKSPLVTFRIVFTTGSAADPADKPGLAYLTAQMIADGGTKDLTYKQIVDALFPMAAGVSAQVDKEMTTFSGATHVDNLDGVLQAAARHAARRRAGARTISAASRTTPSTPSRWACAATTTRSWARKCCTRRIYQGTPYGHYNGGTVSSLEKITLDDVKAFYKSQYSQSQLILGIAGGYSPAFLASMKKDFQALPAGGRLPARIDGAGGHRDNRAP